jgi:hypothetical protein
VFEIWTSDLNSFTPKELVLALLKSIYLFCIVLLFIVIPGCPPEDAGFAIVILRRFISNCTPNSIKHRTITN